MFPYSEISRKFDNYLGSNESGLDPKAHSVLHQNCTDVFLKMEVGVNRIKDVLNTL